MSTETTDIPTTAKLADEFLDLLDRTCDCYAELRRRLGPEYAKLEEERQRKPEPQKALANLPELVDVLEAAIERYQQRKRAQP
jgi:hypothetical protein